MADTQTIDFANEMLIALKVAIAVISQHYPEGCKCCDNKIALIKKALKRATNNTQIRSE